MTDKDEIKEAGGINTTEAPGRITPPGSNNKKQEAEGELETAAKVKNSAPCPCWTGNKREIKPNWDVLEDGDELVRREDAVSHAHKWHDKGVEKERERIREILKDKKNRQEELFKKTGEESYRHTVDQINHVIDLAELDSQKEKTGEDDGA